MLSFNRLGRMGRLGNQMFQYAALFALARACGTEHCIPDSDFADPSTDHQLQKVFALPQLKHLGRQKDVPLVKAETFTFDPTLAARCPKDGDLGGFFQSEKYFAAVADEVRREFQFAAGVEDYCWKVISRFAAPPVSLHVRRGDYLKFQNHFPICPPDYYEAALARVPAALDVLVFSDDIGWCKSQPLFAGRRFTFISGHPNHVDLCLMSFCSHHVIANSSFSWWGAWLGRNPAKTVVAPLRWFGDDGYIPNTDTRDIVPDRWIRI